MKIPGADYYGDYFSIVVTNSQGSRGIYRDLHADLEKNTTVELQNIAKFLKIKNYGKMNKKKLLSAIKVMVCVLKNI